MTTKAQPYKPNLKESSTFPLLFGNPKRSANHSGAYFAGTAVIISPSYALAAFHSLDAINQNFGSEIPFYLRNEKHVHTATTDTYAIQLLFDLEGEIQERTIEWYSYFYRCDMALLKLTEPVFGFAPYAIDARPLEVGDEILAFGYPHVDLTSIDPEIPRKIRVEMDPHVSSGVVRNPYPVINEESNYDGPYHRVTLDILAGYSGGPILRRKEDEYTLVGISSRSSYMDSTDGHIVGVGWLQALADSGLREEWKKFGTKLLGLQDYHIENEILYYRGKSCIRDSSSDRDQDTSAS